MKISLPPSLLLPVVFVGSGLAPSSRLCAQTDLAVTGNLDVQGNTASFGSLTSTPAAAGYFVEYMDGTGVGTVSFGASQPAATWNWRQGTSQLQMQLSSANALTLFPSGSTAPKVQVVGQHSNGIISDSSDRPGFAATGQFPQLVLMAGGSGNVNHGSTVMLGSFDSGTSGSHKHWSIGTSGQNSSFLDFGYYSGTNLNPHMGIRNHGGGSTVMTLQNDGSVGIGTTSPASGYKLDVNGSVKVSGGLTSSGTLTAPSLTLPDGTVSSSRTTKLYGANGFLAATVGADGKVNLSNGISFGTDPSATLTEESTAYLSTFLKNTGYAEGGSSATPVTVISKSSNLTINAVHRSSGAMYVVGEFSRSAHLGGASLDSGSLAPAGFLAKLDMGGRMLWIYLLSSSEWASIQHVALDSIGSVYVAGEFRGNANFTHGGQLTAAGASDMFVAKFSSNGSFAWAKSIGGSSEDRVHSLCVDSASSVVVVGNYSSPIINLGTFNPTEVRGALVVKYNSGGAAQWAKAVRSSSSIEASSVAVAASGDIFVGGGFWGSIDNLGAHNFGGAGGFLLKMNGSGAVQWSRVVGQNVTKLVADGAGSVVGTGRMETTAYLGNNITVPNPGDDFSSGLMFKYDAAGSAQWGLAVGGPGSYVDVAGLAMDDAGAYLVGGSFWGSTTSLGLHNLEGNYSGDNQAYVVQVSGSGTVMQSEVLGDGLSYVNIMGLHAGGGQVVAWGDSGSRKWVVGNNAVLAGSFALSWPMLQITTTASEESPAPLTWRGHAASNANVAFGPLAVARGENSAAIGSGIATGKNAFSAGLGIAEGEGAFAAGRETMASGRNSVALGIWANAVGAESVAMGWSTDALGESSVALGSESIAEGTAAFAAGSSTRAVGNYSFATGNGAVANGVSSVAFGESVQADAYASLAMGRLNVSQGSSSAWNATDDLLTVGNGYYEHVYDQDPIPVRRNALAVHKNGNVRIQGTVQAKGGFRTPPMGDIGMGDFTAGPTPTGHSDTAGSNPATLNNGLRYTGE